MKLSKLLTRLLAVAFTAAGFSVASAAPLTGSVSSAGTICLGSSPTQTVCNTQDASTITYLDFIIGGTNGAGLLPSPGAPGALEFLTASGPDLMPLIGVVGQINDFSVTTVGAFAPVDPLWTAVAGGNTFTYALETLTEINRTSPNRLDILGTGTLCRNGIDCNLFSFIFTTQNALGAIRTTFSLSQSGFAIPEPGSLALLGLGLAALAFRTRRRTVSGQ
jgi:hypothetical protein